MARNSYLQGLLFIGDPHIAGRSPDFRCDDYPNTILGKIEWSMAYAASQKLLPVFLGDLFDKPRDNPTWMMGRLIEILLGHNAICIYGNHDFAEPVLTENDSLMILLKADCLKLVSEEKPWVGSVAGRPTTIGGSSYRELVPDLVQHQTGGQSSLFPEKPFGVWLTHHDVEIPGYEGGRFAPFEIENIDLLINGHIHTRGEPIQKGQTLWITPGNISRRSRSETCRVQAPAVLRVNLSSDRFEYEYVEVPHRQFDQVFHKPAFDAEFEDGASAFVAGLSELRLRKTSSGAGLTSFLEKNLDQFSEPVGEEIRSLALEITGEPLS